MADRTLIGYAQILFPAAIATCLALGIATPFVGAALTLVLLWNGYADQSALILCWSLAGASASLVLIGPGAWSVDAALFGRKRIDVQRR